MDTLNTALGLNGKWNGDKSQLLGFLYRKIAVHSCCFLHLPVAPTAPVERRLFDCYELGDVIGNGGFGSVYSGTSRATGDTVSPQGRHWTGQGQDMTQLNTCSSAWSCNCCLGMLSVTVLHTLQVAVKIIPKSKVFSWSKVSQQWGPVVPTLTLKCWPC